MTKKVKPIGPLVKHTIVIWTEPGYEDLDVAKIKEGAVSGDIAFCSKHKTSWLEEPSDDPDWVETKFFPFILG